ncbi:MAG: hypothetical protein ACJ8CR_08690 [Roseiflexaceae bacterium]
MSASSRTVEAAGLDIEEWLHTAGDLLADGGELALGIAIEAGLSAFADLADQVGHQI